MTGVLHPQGQAPLRAWLVVALLWIVGCLNYLDRVMITTMRSSLKENIPMTDAQFGLLTTGFLIVYGVLSPFAGFLADRFRRSRVIVCSLLVWSLITWLTAHARNYQELLATRLLMGISEAAYMPAALAMVADYHRGRTRSLAIGILLGGVIVGAAMGGLGGAIAEKYTWNFAFTLCGIIGVVYSVILWVGLRDAPVSEAPVIGVVERIRLGAALSSLFRSGGFMILLIYWALLGLAGWAVVGWMPTFLQERFHLTQTTAGLSATVYLNVATLLGFAVGGAWTDRWRLSNPRASIFVSVIGLCVAVPGIFLLSATDTLVLAMVGLALFGFASSFAGTELMPILCLIVNPTYRATGFGVINLFSCVVGGLTIYAGGLLRDAHVEISVLFRYGGAGVLLCGVLLLFVRPKTQLAN